MRQTCDWKLFSDFGIHIFYLTKSKFICLAISTLFISCYDVVHHRTIKPCVSVYDCYCEDNSSLGCGFWYTYQCWVFKLRSVVVYINHVYVYLSSENNAELRDDKRGRYGEPAIRAQDIWNIRKAMLCIKPTSQLDLLRYPSVRFQTNFNLFQRISLLINENFRNFWEMQRCWSWIGAEISGNPSIEH